MFKSKKGEAPEAAPLVEAPAAPVVREPAREERMVNYISAGTVVEGNIISQEDLRMDGRVKGDIKTTARLWLGPQSVVEGNILASEADVAGRITGTVESKGLLAIKSTCRIEGDIVTKSLNVESGSSFNGRCKVGCDAEADANRAASVNRLKTVAAAPAPKAAPAALATN